MSTPHTHNTIQTLHRSCLPPASQPRPHHLLPAHCSSVTDRSFSSSHTLAGSCLRDFVPEVLRPRALSYLHDCFLLILRVSAQMSCLLRDCPDNPRPLCIPTPYVDFFSPLSTWRCHVPSGMSPRRARTLLFYCCILHTWNHAWYRAGAQQLNREECGCQRQSVGRGKWAKGSKGTNSGYKINKFWRCDVQHGDYT